MLSQTDSWSGIDERSESHEEIMSKRSVGKNARAKLSHSSWSVVQASFSLPQVKPV